MRIIIFGVILSLLPSFVLANEVIRDYDVSIRINEDSSANVSERILYDFNDNDRRGIYRIVPTTKEVDGVTYRLNITNYDVVDDNGESYEFEVSESREEWRMDVGGDEPIFTGSHPFTLRYNLAPALMHFDEHVELQWNAIGFNWSVPIEDSTVTVELPVSLDTDSVSYECYVGKVGSQSECLNVIFLDESLESTDDEAEFLRFEPGRQLGHEQGMTISVSLPRDVVTGDGLVPYETMPMESLLILLLAGIPPLFGLYKIYKRGKDPVEGKVVRQYDAPDGISPLELGLVLDRMFGNNEFAAELLSLAIRGHVKIVHYEDKGFVWNSSEYMYVRLQNDEKLADSERRMLDSLFEPRFTIGKDEAKELLSDSKDIDANSLIDDAVAIMLVKNMKKKFHKNFKEIERNAKEEVVRSGYFEKGFMMGRLDAVKLSWQYFALPVLVVGLSTLGIMEVFQGMSIDPWMFGLVVYGAYMAAMLFLSILIAHYFLPRRTESGVEVRSHALGLKQYLEVAEKERMDFHFDPTSNPKLFEKLLPYAVLLGLQDKWIKHLDKLDYQPQWYASTSGASFNAGVISGITQNIGSSTGSSSGSGGVGSAGGGFGGGGGGSR